VSAQVLGKIDLRLIKVSRAINDPKIIIFILIRTPKSASSLLLWIRTLYKYLSFHYFLVMSLAAFAYLLLVLVVNLLLSVPDALVFYVCGVLLREAAVIVLGYTTHGVSGLIFNH